MRADDSRGPRGFERLGGDVRVAFRVRTARGGPSAVVRHIVLRHRAARRDRAAAPPSRAGRRGPTKATLTSSSSMVPDLARGQGIEDLAQLVRALGRVVRAAGHLRHGDERVLVDAAPEAPATAAATRSRCRQPGSRPMKRIRHCSVHGAARLRCRTRSVKTRMPRSAAWLRGARRVPGPRLLAPSVRTTTMAGA